MQDRALRLKGFPKAQRVVVSAVIGGGASHPAGRAAMLFDRLIQFVLSLPLAIANQGFRL